MNQQNNKTLENVIEVKISTSDRKMILINDIIFIKAAGKFSLVYTKEGHEIVTYHLLKWFEDSLPAPCFYRVHSPFLVSCLYVQSYCNNHITLYNNNRVPLSRSRLIELKTNLKSFLESQKN